MKEVLRYLNGMTLNVKKEPPPPTLPANRSLAVVPKTTYECKSVECGTRNGQKVWVFTYKNGVREYVDDPDHARQLCDLYFPTVPRNQ